MTFDEVVTQMGEFGRFQKRVVVLLGPAAMACGVQVMISVFNMAVPHHRCAVPGFFNDTWHIQSAEHAQWINASIPARDVSGYSKCHLYVYDNTTGKPHEEKCHSFVYDKETYAASAVTKWHLVCGRSLYRSHARMVLMGGLLVGALSTGVMADIVGRKRALVLMVGLLAASSVAVAWAPTFLAYVLLRFLAGFSVSGVYVTVFVLGLELVGPRKRMLVGVLTTGFWSLGVMLLGGVAYAVRDWQVLQTAMSLPIALLLSYWWLIPESPRWLLARGREAEAEVIIRQAARRNKACLPDKLFLVHAVGEGSQPKNLCHIFASPVLCLRVLILCCNWLVTSMVFYGLSLNAGSLGGSVYVNFQLMALVEVVAYLGLLGLLNRLGRRRLHVACMLLGGVACLSTVLPLLYASPDVQTWLVVVLSLSGKLGAAAAFAIVYIYSAELFPTVLRNSLMGLVGLFARAGGMISPYVADLDLVIGGRLGKAIPLLVFGSATIGAGLLCLFLPETASQHLPETLLDATIFGRQKRCHDCRQGDSVGDNSGSGCWLPQTVTLDKEEEPLRSVNLGTRPLQAVTPDKEEEPLRSVNLGRSKHATLANGSCNETLLNKLQC